MKSYFRVTRTHTYSILFAVPLLLLYELGAAGLGAGDPAALRNGADVLLRALLSAGGLRGTMAFTGFLLAVGAVLIVAEQRRKRVKVRPALFAGMLAESILYAILLGLVVGVATQWILSGLSLVIADAPVLSLSLQEQLVLSLGAGIYEELVFRVMLVGGLFGIFVSGGLKRERAIVFAVILSALIFSAFHYVGPYGDPWALPSFTFRFLAGLAFSTLFVTRGFGIAAWSHALYDIALFSMRAA